MSMIGELRQVPATLIPAITSGSRDDVIDVVMESAGLSLDKAWDALGNLLGSMGAELDPIMGGDPLQAGDCGYGPPLLLPPDDVRVCATFLAGLDDAALSEAFDPDALAAEEIYPSIWDRPEEHESNLRWLTETFRDVQAFYADAKARGNGVLFFLH